MTKEARIYNGKKTAPSTRGAGKTGQPRFHIMKLEHFLTPYTKINSKWIKDLDIRQDTIKLLEENIGQTLSDVNDSNIFSDPLLRVMIIKTKINKWDFIKLKSFFTAKETLNNKKKTKNRIQNRMKRTQQRNNKLENRSIDIIQSKEQKIKIMKKNE